MCSAQNNDGEADCSNQVHNLLQPLNPIKSTSNGINFLRVRNSTDQTHRETFRLTTFYKFLQEDSFNPLLASAHGFFHTSSPHSIECFSCHNKKSFENALCSEELLRKIHKKNCNFANGSTTDNVPIQDSSPYDIHPNLPDFSVNTPEHHSGLQHSYSSSSVASDLAGPSTASQRNFENHELLGIVNPNLENHQIFDVMGPTRLTSIHALKQPTSANLETIFLCQFPANPSMALENSRLMTFINYSAYSKSAPQLRATPKDFAQAGLYYLGDRDRMKCWYCDGGLKNWKKDDDPWKEHAKWYPTCEFVLRRKGPEYVYKIASEFPNLKRPSVNGKPQNLRFHPGPRRADSGNESTSSSSQWTLDFRNDSFGPSVSWQRVDPLEVIDPQDEKRKREEIIARELTTSEFVPQLKAMGFSEAQIKVTLRRQLERNNEVFKSFEDFLESVLNIPSPKSQTMTPKTHDQQDPFFTSPHLRSSEEERALIESRMCRICRKKPSTVVFLPCGHLVSCADCGETCHHCPLCDSYIREKIRSYIS